MKVVRYQQDYKNDWDNFLTKSKNSTFLFNRNFIEYHQDRFEDFSLIIFDHDDKIFALLPANITKANEVISHQGLTYGAFVLLPTARLIQIISVVYHILKFFNEQQIEVFRLKNFPAFFNVDPTDEIEYILFLLNANLYRCDIAFVVDQQNRIKYTGNIRREANKAEKLAAQLEEDDSFDEFWDEILTPNLATRFGVKPVHSLDEIKHLKSSFPENIKQYNIYLNNKVVAGTTLFITDHVVHCQYISSNKEGRKTGSLNFLFKSLLDKTYTTRQYFDFGVVNEKDGRVINSGMLFWKEAFGGRAKKHTFYKIETASYKRLEQYILES